MNAVVRSLPASLLTQLAERRMFILARRDKHPCDIEGRDSNAQDPLTWLPPAEAASLAELLGLHVGIVLSEGCGLACIDIDSALQPDGTWSPLAVELCQRFPGAYIEVSLSGRGLHIFFSYSGPPPKHRTRWTPPGATNGLHVELYSCARYILITGKQAIGDTRTDHTAALHALIAERFTAEESSRGEAEWTTEAAPQWSGPADTDEGNAELIAKARRSRSAHAAFGNGASFAALWDGDPDTLQRAYPPQSPGQTWDGSAADLALANMLAYWTGGNAERIDRLMKQSRLYRPKHERPDYMRATVLAACASATQRGQYYNDGRKVPVNPNDPRPTIELKGGSLEQNVAALLPLLADSIYVQGGGLVRIGHAEQAAHGKRLDGDTVEVAGIRRAFNQAVCIPVTADWLRLELMRRAQFLQHDERTGRFKAKDCPEEIPGIIVKQGSWTTFRSLEAISAVPVLRPDLSVWTEPGYDPVTHVFYQPTMAIPPILPAPTRDDALAALARLFEPFNEFPYASDVSRAVFVSHIITAVIRASFDTSPVFCYTAPIAATGKTLQAQIPQLIATGGVPATSPYSEGEELRKVLFAALLAGDSSLILDNIPNGWKVRSAELCMFATSANYADRVLGASKRREMPNRCTVTLTGNNITPESDLSRRSLSCRLDVGKESARGRRFRIPDLKSHVREHRAQFIVDVLTVVRAHAFAGRPGTLTPLESFTDWSRLVRDPLVWLGMPDPVASQETETEDEVTPLRGAFAAIVAATVGQEHRFTAAHLAQLVLLPPASTFITATSTARVSMPNLRDALMAAGCKEPADATKLGYWLRAKKDNVAGGWKLQGAQDKHLGVMLWQMRAAA